MFSIYLFVSTTFTITIISSFPVYQKDMSEHCRRHVMPSVFLGRHVSEANSQMLHFSQLEVPYTCFISIRTELGSNILMVVQLMENDSLRSSCRSGNEQLLVYAMGETFGGYWGPLPREYLSTGGGTPHSTKYALKTTTHKPTTIKTTTGEEQEEDEREETPASTARPRSTEESLNVVEIPLLQVSGHLRPSNQTYHGKNDDDDEPLDLLFDVAPRPNETYVTKMVPLVQFAVSKEVGRGGLYQMIYDFKDDNQISYRRITTRRYIPNRYKYHKRLKGHTKRPFFEPLTKQISSDHSPKIESWQDIDELMKNINRSFAPFDEPITSEVRRREGFLKKISEMKHNKSVYIARDWDLYLEGHESENSTEILRTEFLTPISSSTAKTNLTLSKQSYSSTVHKFASEYTHISTSGTTKPFENVPENTLQNDPISSMKVPQVASLDTTKASTTDKEIKIKDDPMPGTFYKAQSKLEDSRRVLSKIDDASATTSLEDPWTVSPSGIGTTVKASDFTKPKSSSELKTATHSTLSEHADGTLVDHESWENIVQSANKMAQVLNQTSVPHRLDHLTNSKKSIRKKRFINPIPVHLEKPHTLSTKRPQTVEATDAYLSDNQKYAHLIELSDDEMKGRVNLRQMGEFVGENFFNICGDSEAKPRQFMMFNSSRIIIAISNFTMKHMTLVLTTAFPLSIPSAVCPPTHMECQVAGSRVCIDSSNACDGIPNCGNFDIYDEDRLICGVTESMQHSVTLAAFTFLAVLLTFIYAVHYWLKRCVPKVSEAFFVYRDNAENVLYLDSIMKSPNDQDDMSKMVHNDPYFDEDVANERQAEQDGRWYRKIMKRISLFKKKPEQDESDIIELREDHPSLKRMYSFAELELKRMGALAIETCDESVQTGESLELAHIRPKMSLPKESKKRAQRTMSTERALRTIHEQRPSTGKAKLPKFQEPEYAPKEKRRSYRDTHIDYKELQIIKAMKEARESIQEASRDLHPSFEVDTLNSGFSAVEETELNSMMYDSRARNYQADVKEEEQASIGSSEHQASTSRRRIRFEEVDAMMSADASQAAGRSVDIDPHNESGTGIDFMRFWGGSKGKKGKKKSQLPLRQ